MMVASDDDRRFLDALSIYGQIHRHPSRPAFKVHEPVTVGDRNVKGSWEGTDQSSRPGCYVLFSEEGVLLYVGKASGAVGHRIYVHKRRDWPQKPAYVRIVEVIDFFEAPSLEEFLIFKLQPPHNKNGVRDTP